VPDLSPQTQDHLVQAVTRWASTVCFADAINGLQLRWLSLAVKHQLAPWVARTLKETDWSCALDKVEARIILRMANGMVPEPQDLSCVDHETLKQVREFVQERGGVDDIDFAVEHLLRDWRAVRGIMRWLGPLAGLTEAQINADLSSWEKVGDQRNRLRDWWKAARATYQRPKATTPSEP
jgi:hypothetical protein